MTSQAKPVLNESASPLEILQAVQVAPRLIEDFKPLSESLEWRLSELYWNSAGAAGFMDNQVPYTITSSGTLSASAAAMLWAACREQRPEGTIRVLETGAGSGLFARLFVEEFRLRCLASHDNFHERLEYFVTDRSPRTVAQWRELGLFADLTCIRPCIADGADPLNVLLPHNSNERIKLSGLHAVFANYCLDSLPSTVLRKNPESGAPEELRIRTHLSSSASDLIPGFIEDLASMRKLAADLSPKLIDWIQALDFEASFQPLEHPSEIAAEALAFGHDWPRIIVNHGATAYLETVAAALAPGGFILINDYGLTQASDAQSMGGGTQRFGNSAALGLNFPLIAHHFSSRGMYAERPAMDERLPLHPLMISAAPLGAATREFHEAFDWDAHQRTHLPQEEARKHIVGGRFDQARKCYEDALRARPRDWALMGEIAEFLIRQIADYESGRRIAAAALALNPWYSVWLCNVFGDALYSLDRFEEAHEIYLKAQAIHPSDVRTAMNLGYTYAQMGDPAKALEAIGRGLAADTAQSFRERLLEKQQQILEGVAAKARAEAEWHARRATRLASS